MLKPANRSRKQPSKLQVCLHTATGLALAELQQGNNELAYAHVLAAVAQERTALHKRRAVHSLHRVQGPLRTELRRLELRARGDLYRRQHGLIPTAL